MRRQIHKEHAATAKKVRPTGGAMGISKGAVRKPQPMARAPGGTVPLLRLSARVRQPPAKLRNVPISSTGPAAGHHANGQCNGSKRERRLPLKFEGTLCSLPPQQQEAQMPEKSRPARKVHATAPPVTSQETPPKKPSALLKPAPIVLKLRAPQKQPGLAAAKEELQAAAIGLVKEEEDPDDHQVSTLTASNN